MTLRYPRTLPHNGLTNERFFLVSYLASHSHISFTGASYAYLARCAFPHFETVYKQRRRFVHRANGYDLPICLFLFLHSFCAFSCFNAYFFFPFKPSNVVVFRIVLMFRFHMTYLPNAEALIGSSWPPSAGDQLALTMYIRNILHGKHDRIRE